MSFVMHLLASRQAPQASTSPSPVTIGLLVALLVLVLVSLAAVGALFALRRRRRNRKLLSILPTQETTDLNTASPRTTGTHHRTQSSVVITTSTSYGYDSKRHIVIEEKADLMNESVQSSRRSLPEIHITFPEEVDNDGQRHSGRVVVVHVGEKGGIGLEPVEVHLPSYQRTGSGRFQSVDLDRIGGLKEARP